MVSFLDGDKDNCSIENLILMDNAVNLEMNRRKLRFTDKDRTKTGMLVSEYEWLRGEKINKLGGWRNEED